MGITQVRTGQDGGKMRITQDRTGWWENEDNTGQDRMVGK